jgi:hypothetical protein
MYLDAAEEKMLRAIVHYAIASAAAGRPFAGEFRHYRISASCLQVNEHGIALVEARIVHNVGAVVQIYWQLVLATREERHRITLICITHRSNKLWGLGCCRFGGHRPQDRSGLLMKPGDVYPPQQDVLEIGSSPGHNS